MPIGCGSYPRAASCRLTVSMTQYCQPVESPQDGALSMPRNAANSSVTVPPPHDSLATSHSTLGRSWTVSTTLRTYAS
jgi:hypothetical protein